MKLTLDFHSNKRVCEEIAHIPSKRLRNQIAGFVTHLIRESKKDQSVESPSSFRRKNVNVVITTSQRCPLWTKKSAKSTKPLRTCWPLSTSVTSRAGYLTQHPKPLQQPQQQLHSPITYLLRCVIPSEIANVVELYRFLT